MKLVFGAFVWGRGGFSLPKSGRPAFAEAASRRQAEVAPTHKEKVKCSFIYAKLNNRNALNLITFNGIAPHPIPLPSGERGG
jgi:hypothetical protein